jgi:hypothetical protein
LRGWWPSCTRGRLETFGAGEEVVVEVIIEEEEYGFMVTNFWVNGRFWRGDQTTSRDQEFKPLMSVLPPAPIPFSTGCKPTITDDDDETEDPESYEKSTNEKGRTSS